MEQPPGTQAQAMKLGEYRGLLDELLKATQNRRLDTDGARAILNQAIAGHADIYSRYQTLDKASRARVALEAVAETAGDPWDKYVAKTLLSPKNARLMSQTNVNDLLTRFKPDSVGGIGDAILDQVGEAVVGSRTFDVQRVTRDFQKNLASAQLSGVTGDGLQQVFADAASRMQAIKATPQELIAALKQHAGAVGVEMAAIKRATSLKEGRTVLKSFFTNPAGEFSAGKSAKTAVSAMGAATLAGLAYLGLKRWANGPAPVDPAVAAGQRARDAATNSDIAGALLDPMGAQTGQNLLTLASMAQVAQEKAAAGTGVTQGLADRGALSDFQRRRFSSAEIPLSLVLGQQMVESIQAPEEQKRSEMAQALVGM